MNRKHCLTTLLKLLLIGLFAPFVWANTEANGAVTDLRVLIDVSGSMKENDPNNLRAPGLKLLVGLLPADTKTGVWTFGTKVKPLLKYQSVDEQWKSSALNAANKITSNDLHTDIEAGLREVIKDWSETDDETNRNIILLTDGMVDLAGGEGVSDDSRARILTELLDELKAKNVTVHTIALSENADQELLDALSLGSNGWYEQVSNADQLQRVFLRMFEKSAPRDTVPLLDNQFTIDNSISEFTLLVFKTSSDKTITVMQPDGTTFEKVTAPAETAWYQEESYDLITVTSPQTGEWSVDADIDPDNRVMVVTDLKLNTSEIPNGIFLGDKIDFEAWLTSEGEPIADNDFYDVISIDLLQEVGETLVEIWSLTDRDHDQVFSKQLSESFHAGRVSLRVIVDGKTFQREQIQTFEIFESPIDVSVKADVKHNSQHAHLLKIQPHEDLIHADTMKIVAIILQPDGTELEQVAKSTLMGDEWLVSINDPMPGEYEVVLRVQADGKHGREIDLKTETYRLGKRIPEQDLASEPDEGDPQEETEPTESENAENDTSEIKEVNWIMVGLILLGINLVLGGIAYFVWIFLRKRRRQMAEPGEEL